MNIFILDKDPVLAAQYQCDKHVVKMILESAQLLSTAVHILNPEIHSRTNLYAPTHKNHPCAIWTRQSAENYSWVLHHLFALCQEYTNRYNKMHKTFVDGHVQSLDYLTLQLTYPQRGLTPFVQAMPEEYRQQDVVAAYRAYYMGAKKDIAKWKLGNVPDWYVVEPS